MLIKRIYHIGDRVTLRSYEEICKLNDYYYSKQDLHAWAHYCGKTVTIVSYDDSNKLGCAFNILGDMDGNVWFEAEIISIKEKLEMLK